MSETGSVTKQDLLDMEERLKTQIHLLFVAHQKDLRNILRAERIERLHTTGTGELDAMATFSEFAESSEARWAALLGRVEALEKWKRSEESK